MPYARPTLTQLRQQALQDVLDGGITNVSAVLRFSVISVICYALAGLSYLHYGYLDWIAKQAVPWTATDEWLEAWGALKGVTRKAARAASSVAVTFPATGESTIPAGSSLILTGSISATTTADSVTSNGHTVAPCVALTTGVDGNVAAGTVATLGSPVPGVQSTGTVTAAFTGGADLESDDDFRMRVLETYKKGGENGDTDDYVRWAKEVSGVTRAWVSPLGFGAGSVVVYIMLDNANAAEKGFPQGADGAAPDEKRYATATGDQLLVANYIYGVRPVTAMVIVCSPIAQPTDFVISSLGGNNTAVNQAAITEALDDMFTRLAEPGGTIYPSQWNEAIAALGLSQFNVASPSAPIIAANIGAMPIRGNISFVS